MTHVLIEAFILDAPGILWLRMYWREEGARGEMRAEASTFKTNNKHIT